MAESKKKTVPAAPAPMDEEQYRMLLTVTLAAPALSLYDFAFKPSRTANTLRRCRFLVDLIRERGIPPAVAAGEEEAA